MSTPAHLVLITEEIDTSILAQLDPTVFQVEERLKSSGAVIEDDLWAKVEILLTLNTLPTPQQAPNLRWIQLYSAGANQIDGHALLQRPGLAVTTASGVHAIPMAEYSIAMLLGLFHQLPQLTEYKRNHYWPTSQQRRALMPRELWGLTMGIVGYGSIGRQIARLAQALGMRVLALQRRPEKHDDGFVIDGSGDPDGTLPEQFFAPDDLHSLLSESDVVVATVPLTAATENMFGVAEFAAMKGDSIFVNVARGAVCDEPALIESLRSGHLGGAVLDVFVAEPLPSDSPLWDMPNVLMSPHISGSHPAYGQRLATLFVANLERYLRGEPLLNRL